VSHSHGRSFKLSVKIFARCRVILSGAKNPAAPPSTDIVMNFRSLLLPQTVTGW
jgi:hypothetical protein